MSTVGFAANVENYGFQIGGQDVTSANIGSLSGVTGKVSYNKTTKTLTLDNVTITVPASVTRVPQGINCRKVVTTIELIGKNEIKFEGKHTLIRITCTVSTFPTTKHVFGAKTKKKTH